MDLFWIDFFYSRPAFLVVASKVNLGFTLKNIFICLIFISSGGCFTSSS